MFNQAIRYNYVRLNTHIGYCLLTKPPKLSLSRLKKNGRNHQ